MQDIESLIKELDERMYRDFKRMRAWRVIHRANGILFSLILILAPAVLAVGLTTSVTVAGKSLLFAIAVVGGLNATFKPYLHSQTRRQDMNAMRRLRDQFQGRLAAGNQGVDPAAVYDEYSHTYSNMYELRGRELIDATLSLDEQRKIAGKNRNDPSW